MARPFRIGATGGPGCSSNPAHSPQLGDGTCRLSMCRWKVSVDDISQRHGNPSQTGPASTPEAISDQQSSGGSLREVSMNGGSLGRVIGMDWRHRSELVQPCETLYWECRDRRLSSARAVDVSLRWVPAGLARPVGGVGTHRRRPAVTMCHQ